MVGLNIVYFYDFQNISSGNREKMKKFENKSRNKFIHQDQEAKKSSWNKNKKPNNELVNDMKTFKNVFTHSV